MKAMFSKDLIIYWIYEGDLFMCVCVCMYVCMVVVERGECVTL